MSAVPGPGGDVHAARRGTRDPHFTEQRRVARIGHLCSWGDCRSRTDARIPVGEVHLLLTEFPGGEAGYADAVGKPVSMRVCHDCARDGIHADLLCPDDLPLLTELTTSAIKYSSRRSVGSTDEEIKS